MNNTSLTNLFVYWKWMQTLQAFSPEYHKRLEVINKKVLFSDWHARVESPHYTASCIRHTDLIVEPVALTGSWYSTTDDQSCSTAAQRTRLWCLLCQVAGGGDTGDDAGQGRVFAGSALLYSPLTNRATHCCSGQRKEKSHSLASFKHETTLGQMGGGPVFGINTILNSCLFWFTVTSWSNINYLSRLNLVLKPVMLDANHNVFIVIWTTEVPMLTICLDAILWFYNHETFLSLSEIGEKKYIYSIYKNKDKKEHLQQG